MYIILADKGQGTSLLQTRAVNEPLEWISKYRREVAPSQHTPQWSIRNSSLHRVNTLDRNCKVVFLHSKSYHRSVDHKAPPMYY